MMFCKSCYGYRLCTVILGLHIGLRKVRSAEERWGRLWTMAPDEPPQHP